ncbi:MAG: hypothetical protein IJ391_02795 [Clostridia bacterium]|nr:hypothetical protein [Clostridia bacterium]
MSERSDRKILIGKIKILEIKNKRLEQRVASLEDKLDKKRRTEHIFEKAARDISIERYASYFKYKYSLIKSTDVWNTAERVIAYSRRSLFIARLIRYSAIIIAIIETSAVFLLCATVFAVIIPVTLLIAIILILIVTVTGKKYNEQLLPLFNDKRIIFILAQKGYKRSQNTYFAHMVRELANDGNYYVIVISRSISDGLFFSARLERENLAVIRESYFFKLRRAIRKAGIDSSKMIIVH